MSAFLDVTGLVRLAFAICIDFVSFYIVLMDLHTFLLILIDFNKVSLIFNDFL